MPVKKYRQGRATGKYEGQKLTAARSGKSKDQARPAFFLPMGPSLAALGKSRKTVVYALFLEANSLNGLKEWKISLRSYSAPRTNVYFAPPVRSWKRGPKENSKGLLRQYFRKSKGLVEAKVQRVVDRLHHRRSKTLGFRRRTRYSSEWKYANQITISCCTSCTNSPNKTSQGLKAFFNLVQNDSSVQFLQALIVNDAN